MYHILSKINTLYPSTPHILYFKIYFNVILPRTRVPKALFISSPTDHTDQKLSFILRWRSTHL